MGNVYDRDHSIFKGVTREFYPGTWTGHAKCQQSQGSKLLASWVDGFALAAEKLNPKNGVGLTMAFNFGCVTKECQNDAYWSTNNSDIHLMIFNACMYISKRKPRMDWRKKILATMNKVQLCDVTIVHDD